LHNPSLFFTKLVTSFHFFPNSVCHGCLRKQQLPSQMSSFICISCTSFLFFIKVMNTSQAPLYRMAHYRSLFNKTEIRWKNVWFIGFSLDMRNCRIHIDNWLPTSPTIKNSQVGKRFVCLFTTPTIRLLLENWLGPRKLVHRSSQGFR
jgi:hypothetical protein